MDLIPSAAAASLSSICSSGFVFFAAKAFIGLAFFAAIAYVIVYSIVEIRGAKTQTDDPAKLTAWDKVLDSLKGVLEALAKLPHWVAIFLAGLALLWMAGQRPAVCQPPEVPPTGQPAR